MDEASSESTTPAAARRLRADGPSRNSRNGLAKRAEGSWTVHRNMADGSPKARTDKMPGPVRLLYRLLQTARRRERRG